LEEYIGSVFRAEEYAKDKTAHKWAAAYLFITAVIRIPLLKLLSWMKP
jgi:hypothetical protein